MSRSGDEISIEAANLRSWHRDSLPFDATEEPLPDAPDSNRFVRSVEDGWLVGYGAGEFGGSLWWIGHNGERRYLSEMSVRGIVEVGGRIFVISGLAHAGTRTGRLFEASHGKDGRWSTSVVAELPGFPLAYSSGPDGALLMLTSEGLVRLTAEGVPVTLTSDGYFALHPRSLVVMPSGSLLIGMNLYLLRLTPEETGYREEWFLPEDCARFELIDGECICEP